MYLSKNKAPFIQKLKVIGYLNRSAMMEGSGTLESQLEATKVTKFFYVKNFGTTSCCVLERLLSVKKC